MKICEFTVAQLEAKLPDSSHGSIHMRTPLEQSLVILKAALETVNQAGLDGKKLSDLTIIHRRDPARHIDDQVTEIHAKVTHRLKA